MSDPDWDRLFGRDDRLTPGAPNAPVAIASAEASLGVVFRADLRGLYAACDGVFDSGGQWFVIWRLVDVVARNLDAWQREGGDRTAWLGFGDDGTGNPFCVPRDGGPGVHHWSTIDHSASPLGADLRAFWQAEWPSGESS